MTKDRFAEIYAERLNPKPEFYEKNGLWFCKGQDPSDLNLTLIGCGKDKMDAIDIFVRSLPNFRKENE